MRTISLFFLSFLGVSAAFGAVETRDFDSKGLKELNIENSSGKVTIVAAEGPKATVKVSKNSFSEKCKLTLDRSGDKLVVKVKKTAFFSLADCDVDLEVSVPKATDLDLALGSGDLKINGIKGVLDFKVGSGDILADGYFDKIDGKTGNGKVDVKGLTGGGEVNVGSGGVHLSFAGKSLRGELDLKVGSGDSTLLFPKGSKVKTSFKGGSGDLTNEIGDSSNSDFKVSAKTGSGNLKVSAY